MKAAGLTLLGCAVVLALVVSRDAITARAPAPPTGAVQMQAAPLPAPRTSQALVGKGVADVGQGFAEVGTAFRRSADSATSTPDRLAEAESAARSHAEHQAQDAATTRADTVPASTPREL